MNFCKKMIENCFKMVGYGLSIGALLGLVAYGVYALIPELISYLSRPPFLFLAIGIFGVLLVFVGLIIERIREERKD